MSENILQSFTLAPTQLVYYIIQKNIENTKYFQLIIVNCIKKKTCPKRNKKINVSGFSYRGFPKTLVKNGTNLYN